MISLSKWTVLISTLTSLFIHAESTSEPPLGAPIVTNGADLQVLDKITGNMSTISAQLNDIVKFGTLRIRIKYCQKNAPEDVPESKSFVEIWEEKAGEESTSLFSNWMFSSSPSLSTLEHPVYGVWLKECVTLPKAQKQ